MAVYARRGGVRGDVLVILHRRLGLWLPIGGELEDGETPLLAAVRELREETGLGGQFPGLKGACEGVPPGFLGYEEHVSGAKGLHMNFVFVADVADDAVVVPNDEFGEYKWIDWDGLMTLEAPKNVLEFGFLALEAT